MMLAKCMGRHKRGLLAVYVVGLFLLLIFIGSLFVRSVEASVWYDILYFHAGGTMDQNAGGSQVSTKISPGPLTLTIRPNAAGTYQAWGTFGAPPSHWEGTSDQNDATGVQVTGSTTLKETENLQDTTQTGTINSVTAYMRAKASGTDSATSLYAHQETTTIAGTSYYLLKTDSADAAGTSLSYTSAAGGETNVRGLFGKFVFQLSGVTSISASTWTIYYRQYYVIGPGGSFTSGHYDVNILIRQADGTVRTTIATDVATSGTLTTSWATVSGTYDFLGYTVVDQTDYLEIDFYVHQTSKKVTFYLRIDDNTLALADQTRASNVIPVIPEKAVIIWRTYSTDYESDVITISRTAFTDYSKTRTTNPNTGSAWTWTEVNSLEVGARASTVGSTEYIQVSEFWVEVTYSNPSISWSANYWTDDWWVGVSAPAWSVVFYFDALGGELATGTVTVTVSLTDKTPVSEAGVTCSGDTGSEKTTYHDVSGWADRDATTTWLNDYDPANPSRTLTVTIQITSGGPIAIEYDAGTGIGGSRLNTGTIIPENFLQLILAAPFIPLIAKAVVRWPERRSDRLAVMERREGDSDA